MHISADLLHVSKCYEWNISKWSLLQF